MIVTIYLLSSASQYIHNCISCFQDNENSLIDRYEINGKLCARRRIHLRDNTEFQLLQWRVKRQVVGFIPKSYINISFIVLSSMKYISSLHNFLSLQPGEQPPNPPYDSSADIVKALHEVSASNKQIAAANRALADSIKALADQEKQRMEVIVQNHDQVMAALTKKCDKKHVGLPVRF